MRKLRRKPHGLLSRKHGIARAVVGADIGQKGSVQGQSYMRGQIWCKIYADSAMSLICYVKVRTQWNPYAAERKEYSSYYALQYLQRLLF